MRFGNGMWSRICLCGERHVLKKWSGIVSKMRFVSEMLSTILLCDVGRVLKMRSGIVR